MAIGASEYTELITSTLEQIEEKLVDQVLLKHPTLDLFRKHAKSDSGRKLVLNLEGAQNGSTAFSDASGSFSSTVSDDIMGAAEYDWSDPLVSHVRLKHTDLEKNAGSRTQLVDLLKSHIESAKKGHARTIARSLHALYNVSEGSTATQTDQNGDNFTARGPQSGQGFFGFDAIVGTDTSDTANLSSDVGGIDAGSNGYWEATRLTSSMGSDGIRKAFRTMRNELAVATSNMGKVDAIIAGRAVFEEYEDALDDKIRYVAGDSKTGPDGPGQFRAFYDGEIEVRLDPDCPPDRAYFLDLDSFRFRYLNDNWMRVHQPQAVQNTLDFVTPIASIISVGVNERRANGVLIRTA